MAAHIPHDPGHDLGRRQERAGDRPVPLAQAPRRARGAVQTAKYGAQQRRDRRRRRDRSRPGGTGTGLRARSRERHESGVAEAEFRHRRAGHHSRQGGGRSRRARVSPLQTGRAARGARVVSASKRALRRHCGRRRGFAGGDQPARQRHRQHGFRRGRGLSGGARCRHRPRRRICASRRHARAALGFRTRARAGFRHQPLPRRSGAVATGNRMAERETSKPVLGVLPYLHGLHLEAEDALPRNLEPATAPGQLRAVAPAIHGSRDISASPARHRAGAAAHQQPHRISMRCGCTLQVALRFVGPNEAIPAADLIILPGSKNVRADLAWLRTHGWDKAIARHLRYGGKLIGLCGGFQMLGTAIHDPHGLEGEAESSAGLGLLAFETTLEREKQLHRIRGVLALASAPVQGYEIHMGISHGPALERPALHLNGRTDGAISEDGQILGTYLHGLFDVPAACDALLAWAGLEAPQSPDHIARREAGIDRLADAVEQYLDTRMLEKLFGLTPSQSARRQAP